VLVGTSAKSAGLERYLVAHGIKPELPLKAGEFGVRDPEGNLVIFVQSGSNKMVADAPPSPNTTSKRMIHVAHHAGCRQRGRVLARHFGLSPLLARRQFDLRNHR
jgi:hypothetical protein